MADIGTAYVRIAPNMTGIQGKIAAGFKGAGSTATAGLADEVNGSSGIFQGAIGKLGDIAKVGGVAIAGGIAAGVTGLAALTGKALMAGAELEQNLGGAEAVFGQYADSIKQAAQTAYESAGLSQNEFLQGANKMGSLFQGAGFSVQDSMKMTQDAMQRASDVASIMGISTTDALEAVTGMAKGNFTMMDNLGVAMNDTALGAYALSKGINKSTTEMSTQEKVGLAQQLFMEKTAKYAGNYAKENESLSGSLNTTKKAFDNFMSGEGSIDDFINSAIRTINIGIPQLVKLIPNMVDAVGAVLAGLVPALAQTLPTLLPALINAVSLLLQSLVTALPQVINVLLGAMPMFIDAFIKVFLAILQALPTIVTTIANALPTIINAIVTGLTNPTALQAIIMGAVTLLLALVQAIPIIVNALIVAIPVIIKNILAVLTNPTFIQQMIGAGVQLLMAVIAGIGSMGRALFNAASSIIGTITNVLSWSSLSSIGSNVAKGLWSGIESMGGWLKDKIMNFVKDKIPGAVRNALGIHSPSRVAAALGKQVPAGLAMGINANTGVVETAATNMANSAIANIGSPLIDAGIMGSAAAGGAIAGNTSNSTQTVTIGQITLGSTDAVREFFRSLNQDTINIGMGITPGQGAL